MHMQSLYPVVGLVVGLIVGLTGVGGGSLMTPTLVFLFKVPLELAIGTDLVFAALTKMAGVAAHGVRGNVNWRIMTRLAAGSLPASIVTIFAMSQFKAHGKPLDHFVLPLLGFSLVATAAAVMLRKRILAAGGKTFELSDQTANRLATVVGVVLGVMVTLTSVGAGAIRSRRSHAPLSKIARRRNRGFGSRARNPAGDGCGTRSFADGQHRLSASDRIACWIDSGHLYRKHRQQQVAGSDDATHSRRRSVGDGNQLHRWRLEV